jgi:5-formyltetrahydrofolate cyclo-ligase
MLVDAKQQLREKLRTDRQKIDAVWRQHAAHAAVSILQKQPLWTRCQHIACYFSKKNEFDSLPLIHAIWAAGKQCYLPVMSKDTSKQLFFVTYQASDILQANKYNVLEPEWNAEKIFPTEQLDLVFLPLLGFDLSGHRWGAGGGYYDRTFAFTLDKNLRSPSLIGLGYQQQQVDILPVDDWDVYLEGVLTEKNMLLF